VYKWKTSGTLSSMKTKDMVSVGIDIGTTNVTILALNCEDGQILEIHSLPNQRIGASDGYSYLQDPQGIENTVRGLLGKVRAPFSCLGVTGQVHGIVYYDQAGMAVSPLYTWLDRRAMERVEGVDSQSHLLHLTGKSLPSGYGLLAHYANRRLGQVPPTAVGFTGIMEYITARLIGHPLEKADPSSLSAFGAFDPATTRTDTQVLKTVLGDNPLAFPTPAAAFETAGRYEGNTPVAYPVGDNQAAFFGVIGDPRKHCLISIGTSGQISLFTSKALCPPSMELRPCVGPGYLQVGATLSAGKTYEVLERLFHAVLVVAGMPETDHETVFTLMKKAAMEDSIGIQPLVFDTRLNGSRHDPLIRGSLTGLGLDNLTLGNLVRSTVDGVVGELHDFTVGQEVDFNQVETVVATGSAVRKNPLFIQSLRRQFNREVRIPHVDDGAAVGAALIGAVSGGMLTIGEAQSIASRMLV